MFTHRRIIQPQGVLGRFDDPLAGVPLFRSEGCRQCLRTGFRSRVAEVHRVARADRIIAACAPRIEKNPVAPP